MGGILSDINVENIYIFIADALRWDYLPEQIESYGVTAKTVAVSPHTHTSLPTMLSGLWPSQHRVHSWNDKMPPVRHLLNEPKMECSFFQPGPEEVLNDGTFKIFEIDERQSVEDATSPFINIERHHGGHAPYNAIEYDRWSWDDFLREFSGNPNRIKEEYKKAVDATTKDFLKRYEYLKENQLLDNTLVVFCSDHGEYLGERGLVGHTSPLRPEVTYVPTVFIHPELDEKKSTEKYIRHIDIYPTILRALDRSIPNDLGGNNLFEETGGYGYSVSISNLYARNSKYEIIKYRGVWDNDGGIVYNKSGYSAAFVALVALALGRSWKNRHLRKSPLKIPQVIQEYVFRSKKFGDTQFTEQQARDFINNIESLQPRSGETETSEIPDKTKEQLKELGYL